MIGSACDWLAGTGFGRIVDAGGGGEFEAADIAVRVAQQADNWRTHGLEPGSLVTIALDDALPLLVGIFAAWRLGLTVAVLDASLSPPERANVERFLSPVLRIDAAGEVLAGGSRRFPAAGLDTAALVLLTSGTTGDPKGVVLSHRALLARVGLNRAHIGDAALTRTLLTLPLHFGHGLIGNALTPLAAGATLVLHPRGPTLAARLGSIVDGQGITFLSSVPSFWQLALRSPPPQGGTLRRVHVGSAPLSGAFWRRISAWTGCAVVNCYGITETANWIAGEAGPEGVADGAVGRPWGGSFAVRGSDGKVAPSGEGEVLVRTPSLMSGYLDRPDLTEAVLAEGWYATGDTGRIDETGSLTLTGRIKDEINRAGQKIQPADIDLVVEAHPGVAEACTFGVADPLTGEAVAVAVAAQDGAELSRDVLMDWCAARLRPNAVPQHWFFVEAIPRTPRGKISRRAVRESLARG